MKTINYKIEGASPLLMNSDKYVDPLNPKAKELKSYTSKRKKTDEDYLTIARLAWEGAIHCNEKQEVIVPTIALFRSIQSAARLNRQGKQVERGLIIRENELPLIFPDMNKKAFELFGEGVSEYVSAVPKTVQRSKVMRYRPVFSEWGLEFTIDYDEDMLDFNLVSEMVDNAGKYIGLLDERPFYGKFKVIKEELA